jgi:hypothetical protein
MPRKRPKSLETDVYRKLWQLEHYAYVRCHLWKKSYRFTLIDEFRQHITAAKYAYILGYEILLRYRNEKVKCYNAALGELSTVESNMDHMTASDNNITN